MQLFTKEINENLYHIIRYINPSLFYLFILTIEFIINHFSNVSDELNTGNTSAFILFAKVDQNLEEGVSILLSDFLEEDQGMIMGLRRTRIQFFLNFITPFLDEFGV